MRAEREESGTSLRDREPSVKNTTNRMKDSFLLRAASTRVGERRRGRPPATLLPPSPPPSPRAAATLTADAGPQ